MQQDTILTWLVLKKYFKAYFKLFFIKKLKKKKNTCLNLQRADVTVCLFIHIETVAIQIRRKKQKQNTFILMLEFTEEEDIRILEIKMLDAEL